MKSLPRALALATVLAAGFALPAAGAPAQTFQTGAGVVTITPIYHAAAEIQAGGSRIYIDPAKPAKIDGMPPADLILITDIHGDHMDPADIGALSKPDTVIIAPAAVPSRPMRGLGRYLTGSIRGAGASRTVVRTSVFGS